MALADNMPKDAIGDMKRQIRDLQRDIREMRAERRLEAATIGAGGLTVKGGMIQLLDPSTGDVLALLDAAGLTVDGNAAFGGNVAITGTLSLPAGIIDNDALANPVVPGVVNLYTSNFSLPSTSYAEITGVNLTVPAGCTILAFTGTGSLDCYNAKTTGGNNGSGGDYIYPQVRVGSNTSPGNWATGVSGNSGNATATRGFSTLLTGLTPGATVRASVYGVSDYGISADPGNLASLSATLNWFR